MKILTQYIHKYWVALTESPYCQQFCQDLCIYTFICKIYYQMWRANSLADFNEILQVGPF